LIFLTFKMIGVYFGRDDIKERLKWEYKLAMLDAELSYYFYREKIEHLKKTCADNKPLYTNKQIQQINSRYQAFQNAEIIGFTKTVNKEKIYLFTELVNQLKEKTLQALNSNDFSIVQENIDLLIEAEDVFNLLDILDSIITYNIMCTLVKTKF